MCNTCRQVLQRVEVPELFHQPAAQAGAGAACKQQIWTALQDVGPIHLGFALKKPGDDEGAADRRVSAAATSPGSCPIAPRGACGRRL